MKYDFADEIKFNAEGLAPAVIQDAESGQVLMVAYMNRESLQETLRTGKTVFWSRSRRKLWRKGETSGNEQTVLDIRLDCDEDAILIKVSQKNGACHTGKFSCFYRRWEGERLQEIEEKSLPSGTGESGGDILERVYAVIQERIRNLPKDSYVSSLFKKGEDAILKKVAEEAGEVLLSSKGGRKEEIIWEITDLWFHTLLVLGYHGIPLRDLFGELEKREGKTGLRQKPGKKEE
ncbi:MAG TPA: bifunctional phosphoribosyl-AMP cyclohydrolase/phosphoribosyl-ATP diphosphatase HisIE [Nitrospiria bacterium]|nr:bifunctional phosphoribosyl-AMP cyclohydrolase/phosphoribosyl-ATP diphosphatase HisIE [Nitrospiria bacterium]